MSPKYLKLETQQIHFTKGVKSLREELRVSSTYVPDQINRTA